VDRRRTPRGGQSEIDVQRYSIIVKGFRKVHKNIFLFATSRILQVLLRMRSRSGRASWWWRNETWLWCSERAGFLRPRQTRTKTTRSRTGQRGVGMASCAFLARGYSQNGPQHWIRCLWFCRVGGNTTGHHTTTVWGMLLIGGLITETSKNLVSVS
jgi:hypothetical protein